MLTEKEKKDLYQRICDAMADGENELSLAYLGVEDLSNNENSIQNYAAEWLEREHNISYKSFITCKYEDKFYNIAYW